MEQQNNQSKDIGAARESLFLTVCQLMWQAHDQEDYEDNSDDVVWCLNVCI